MYMQVWKQIRDFTTNSRKLQILWLGKVILTYKRSGVVTFASEGVAQPYVIFKFIHI